jgi:2-succinyl-5-enolpyruvyl-6-hydroxy-3-cyclohexene-1-carboxylate synthase
VSGIDGNLSTLAGLNVAGVPTLGLLGDLAFFHDLSGLLLAERLRLPVIVINNGGGRIFDYLPQRGLPGFETLWQTPVGLDIERLAPTFGVTYREASDADQLTAGLEATAGAAPAGLIEVRIDAESSRRVHQDFWRLIQLDPAIAS